MAVLLLLLVGSQHFFHRTHNVERPLDLKQRKHTHHTKCERLWPYTVAVAVAVAVADTDVRAPYYNTKDGWVGLYLQQA